MKKTISLCLVSVLCIFNVSCASKLMYSGPASPLSVPGSASLKWVSENSVSSATRTVVKSGSIGVKVASVKTAGDRLEGIVTEKEGYMTSMSRTKSESHRADYEIRVPAKNLVSTMDEIADLGEVDRKRIWVSDETKQVIQFQAKLKELKTRRDRYKRMLSSANKLEDKIQLEEILSKVEKEIFEMEFGLKQVLKHSSYSKLSVDLERKKIRGPLGLVTDGWGWSWRRLFTIRG